MKAEITHTPVGCYRPFKKYASELNDHIVCRKFKPGHDRIIVGIHTLECCLDLTNKEHANIYLKFISTCNKLLKDGNSI